MFLFAPRMESASIYRLSGDLENKAVVDTEVFVGTFGSPGLMKVKLLDGRGF